jgi:hypothetical protein
MSIDEPKVEMINFERILTKLKSTIWFQKVEAYEELLRYLIDFSPEEIQETITQESTFPAIIEVTIRILEKDTVFKLLEIGMDFVEFIMSSYDEALFDHI